MHREITNRVAKGDVVFDWMFTLASEADDETDPTTAWPASRKQLSAGQIVISDVTPQLNGECHSINYDPLVPTGIETTRDPILRARSAAYAEVLPAQSKRSVNG